MKKISTLLTVAALMAAAWAPSQAGADVIYHQAFENSSGVNQAPSDYLVSFYANHSGGTATDLSSDPFFIRSEDGLGTHQPNVNAPDPYDDAVNGTNGQPLGRLRINTGTTQQLLFTEFNSASFLAGEDGGPGAQPSTVDPDNWLNLMGSVDISHSAGAGNTRFAVRIGGMFYVEEIGSTSLSGSHTVDLLDGTSLWKELLFTEDVELGISAAPAVTLSSISGPITALGTYMNNATNTVRMDGWNLAGTSALIPGDINGDGFVGIDDLNVVLGNWNAGTPPTTGNATIPEPASLVLVGIGCSAILRRRR